MSRLAIARHPPPGWLSFIAVFVASLTVAAGVLPVLMREVGRDWRTFALSARNLALGQDLYFEGDRLINLYPPPMAILWSWGMTPQLWLVVALVASTGVATLGRSWASIGLYVLTMMQATVLYDLLIGNVSTLYVGGLALRLAFPGPLAGIPLGIMLGIAPKPALVPIMLLMLLKAPRLAVAPLVVAAGINLVTLVFMGPEPYGKYLSALFDSQRQLASTWVGGNLGLARMGTPFVIGGMVVAGCGFVLALRSSSIELVLAAGLGLGLLVQPTLGFWYAAMLIPGVILLWRHAPWTAILVAVAGMLTAILTPSLSGLILAAGALSAMRSSRAIAAPDLASLC